MLMPGPPLFIIIWFQATLLLFVNLHRKLRAQQTEQCSVFKTQIQF